MEKIKTIYQGYDSLAERFVFESVHERCVITIPFDARIMDHLREIDVGDVCWLLQIKDTFFVIDDVEEFDKFMGD